MFKFFMQLFCGHYNLEIEHISDNGTYLQRCPDCGKHFLKKYPSLIKRPE